MGSSVLNLASGFQAPFFSIGTTPTLPVPARLEHDSIFVRMEGAEAPRLRFSFARSI